MKQATTATEKKAAPKKKAASVKFKTVDEYIQGLPVATQKIVKELRKTIRAAAPQAEESISYNMPMYKWNGMLISFAAWKQHIGIYPLTATMEASIKALAPYKGDKHTVKLPLDKPLPVALVTRMVKFRLKENQV